MSGSDVPAFPRSSIMLSLRHEAKRVTRGNRIVYLAYGEAKDAVAAWDEKCSEVSSLVSALVEIRDTVNDPREIAIRALERHAKGGKG